MYISNDRERVLNLVTYIQWEKPQVIEYDKICNGLKALSGMLSIYSYIIILDARSASLWKYFVVTSSTPITHPRK